ncbi:hypothetical protein A2V61_00290 [Candidatus Woesebacteria bacterium RBG_19FT_COMBO_47_8]|nr:MAG: hypothetical protein A2V61_00290 [Candidatus Woesebacteria bacterium RBG_19FT_COMBO_47_8]
MSLLAPLFSLFLPFLVWPVEYFFPYPFIVEEIAKGVLIYFVATSREKIDKIKMVAAIGVLFAFSETVLYLFNIYLVGNISTLLQRLMLTTSLHVITSLIIYLPAIRNKKYIVLGVVLAGVLHYFFNFYIGKVLLL